MFLEGARVNLKPGKEATHSEGLEDQGKPAGIGSWTRGPVFFLQESVSVPLWVLWSLVEQLHVNSHSR